MEEPGFLDGVLLYNRFLTEHYPNRFQKGPCTAGAGQGLEEALSSAEDHSAVLTAIGPLNNISRFLDFSRGRELAGRELKQVVSMAGGLKKPEWNVEMDIPAARKAFFALSGPGHITVKEDDFPPSPEGNARFLPNRTGAYFDSLWEV